MPEPYPHLRALIDDRASRNGNGRMILIGVIVILALVAVVSKGRFTLPFIGLVLLIVMFFTRLERLLVKNSNTWESFLASIAGSPREHQLAELERDLEGESIEWTNVRLTENFLLWPADLARGRFTHVQDIQTLDTAAESSPLSARTNHQLVCDTRYAGTRLTLSLDDDESREIFYELRTRYPDIPLAPGAYGYFFPTPARVD